MARLTVEDCLPQVENRFDLVLKAAKRARDLERGATAQVAWENDKPTVVALREIAAGVLNTKALDYTAQSEDTTAEAKAEDDVDAFIAEEMQSVSEVAEIAEPEIEVEV